MRGNRTTFRLLSRVLRGFSIPERKKCGLSLRLPFLVDAHSWAAASPWCLSVDCHGNETETHHKSDMSTCAVRVKANEAEHSLSVPESGTDVYEPNGGSSLCSRVRKCTRIWSQVYTVKNGSRRFLFHSTKDENRTRSTV